MPTTKNDISELILQARSGDTAAFGLIVRRYQGLVSGLLYSVTGDFHQSEDLAQETFLIAWNKLAELENIANPAPWLCTIARNLVNRSFRKKTVATVNHSQVDEVSSMESEPSMEVQRVEQSELVWSAIGEMDEIYRETLVLYYRSGQSVSEIAEATDLTEEAVRQRLVRARKSLKSKLEQMIGDVLVDSAPGELFTYSVMAAVTGTVFSTAQTAVAGTTGTIATGGTGKAMGLGTFWVLLGPLFYFVWMFAIVFVSQWTITQNTPTLRARRYRIHSFFLACQYFIPYVCILGVVMAGCLSLMEQVNVPLSGPSVLLFCFFPGFGICFLLQYIYQRRVQAITRDDLGLSEHTVGSYSYEHIQRRLQLSVITNVLLLETALPAALILPFFRGIGTWWTATITLAVSGMLGIILYAYYLFGRHFLLLGRSQASMIEYPPLIDDPFGVVLGMHHKAPASIDHDYRKKAGRLYWLQFLIWLGFGGAVLWYLLSLIPWHRQPVLIGFCVAGLAASIGIRMILRRKAKEKKTFYLIDSVMGLCDTVCYYVLLGLVCGSFSFRELYRSIDLGPIGPENMIRMPLFLVMVISFVGSVVCMFFWLRLHFSTSEKCSKISDPSQNPILTPLQQAIVRYHPRDEEQPENLSTPELSKQWIRIFVAYGMVILVICATVYFTVS